MITASAPAKLILCGEHAVVYGRPALALPLATVRARARIVAGAPGSGVVVDARDLGRRFVAGEAHGEPLGALVRDTLAFLKIATPNILIEIFSDIPIASGMGSGAAVATALVRALAVHAGRSVSNTDISALVYGSEQRLHGTPSGIDNAVVAFEQPIWFVRTPAAPLIEPIGIAAPLRLLVGDTGVRSATRLPVGAVRKRWQSESARYEALFDAASAIAHAARAALASGDIAALGTLLDRNHALLQEIGVSSPDLDRLVHAARNAGALGAKLSGAGWGGVMLALVAPETEQQVVAALRAAKATRVLATTVAAN